MTESPAETAGTAGTALSDGPVHGVNILVPSFWYEFDIHPATRDEAIRRAVRAHVKQRPELAEHQAAVTKVLRKVAREAWSSGVIYFGAMAEIYEEAPMTANLTITVQEARDEETGELLPNEPGAVMSALKPIPKGRRPTDPWRRVQVVQLPDAGPAARGEGIEDIELPGDPRIVRMVLMQTIVPFPDDDPRVAMITAASPQLELAEPMLELFDGITSTFNFVRAQPEIAN